MQYLSFQYGNSKIPNTWTFSLPAGFSCPGAKDCLAKVPRIGGPLVDGPDSMFRCFAASQELLYSKTRESRWQNFELLRQSENMADLIEASLPAGRGTLYRIHVSGDFFSSDYLAAWFTVARAHPTKTFYAYTKSLPAWIALRHLQPANFHLVASKGGQYDHLIEQHHLKYAEVVFSLEEAAAKGLAVDHDDTHAHQNSASFALLIHGNQARASAAGRAISALRKQGIYGYGRRPTEPSKIASFPILAEAA